MFFNFKSKDFEFWNHVFIYLLNILLELCENELSIVILEKKKAIDKKIEKKNG